MKEKNMWKELLNRAGWILVFLLAVLFISGSPSGYLYFDFKRSSPATVRADSCWPFNCGSGSIYYGSS